MDHSGFTTSARLLHWLTAVLVLLTLPAGLIMVQNGIDRGLQNALFIYHKNVGVLIFVIVMVRLFLRWQKPPPPRAARLPLWQERTAAATHIALYGLLIVLPVAGYIRVRAGGFPIEALDALGVPALIPQSEALEQAAKTVHYLAGLAISVVVTLHVGAAFFHAIVKRDRVFSRMWPPLGSRRR